ncbi:MAG TPA: type VI secretion system accessory protein TagJ [Prosthecobacter sp.]
MTPQEEIQQQLKGGSVTAAIAATKAAIRKAPTDPELRFMLFQTLSLAADWEGASNQLVAYSELVGRQSPLPVVFNDVIRAEVRRKHVFLGEEAPTIFGEPPEWVSYLVQSLAKSAKGNYADAIRLRAEALELAPAVSGSINGQPFEWLMDGDSRLGTLIEAIFNGQYYWVPQARVRSITLEEPTHVRDAVWTAAELALENGARISAFIPTRYPGAAGWKSELQKLSRETDWESPAEGFYIGTGQRVLMTDSGEFPLLDIRQIEFNAA